MSDTELTLSIVQRAADIDADEWDACARGVNSNASPNPFCTHAFFVALEESGSASAQTGWAPVHLVARHGHDVVGIAPCYLKSHSRGEYVFDHGWAEALQRAGGQYYPKLQVSVPFTPATGPRLMVRVNANADTRQVLARGLIALCGQLEASSAHVTFLTQEDEEDLVAQGFLKRTDQQFHWRNTGFSSFNDFLASLNARHRKIVKRERREALQNGISIHWLSGDAITPDVWDSFFAFYMDTGSRKWGRPYLNRDFYTRIGETMRASIVLIMAQRAGKWIAGAINFIGKDTLYGRHWGAIEHHPFLHFEVCYYQAIEFAIAHGLKVVEAGAQGEHKIARGYLPQVTHSVHYIAHPGLRRAVADYLVHERAHSDAFRDELETLSPYRHESDKSNPSDG